MNTNQKIEKIIYYIFHFNMDTIMDKTINSITLDHLMTIYVEARIFVRTEKNNVEVKLRDKNDLIDHYKTITLGKMYTEIIIGDIEHSTKNLLLTILNNAVVEKNFDTFFEELSEVREEINELRKMIVEKDMKS